MPRRTNSTSQPYLSPTRRAATERASPVALAQFRRRVRDHNIPYWGTNVLYGSSTWWMGNFETFPLVLCLPFKPSHSAFHTRCSPWLNLPFMTAFIAPLSIFSEDRGNPPYEFHFHLAPVSEIYPPSKTKSSSSSSMAESQSSHRSSALSSSVAKLQLFSRYNSCSNDSSNPHSPGLDNWQSDRSSNWSSDSYIDGPSDDLSHPHTPGLDPWKINGSVGEGKGSSSDVYNCKTDDGQVSQGSSGSSSSSKK
jgi:hypothetical protein